MFKAYEALGLATQEAGPLPPKTRALVKLALAVGARLEGAVHSHTRRAVEAGCSADDIRHVALAADLRDLSHAQELLPGGSCPLCHFPTFEWTDVNALNSETLATLRAQFPRWTPEQGACKRCVEIYEIAGKFEAPATMVL